LFTAQRIKCVLTKWEKKSYDNAGSVKKEMWTIKGAHLQGFGLDSETYFAKIREIDYRMKKE
jgi:hypothetical protein